MSRFHKLAHFLDSGMKTDQLMAGAPLAPAPTAGSMPKPAPKQDRSTDMRIGAERTAATAAERARWAMVFACKASVGRERDCATLLASPKAFGADQIIGYLAEGPTTASRAKRPANAAKTDRVWDRAYNVVAAAAASEANDPWAKAYAKSGER